MAIITFVKDYQIPQESILNIYPDQMVSEEVKKSDGWIKSNMDYFYSIAINRYVWNEKHFARNYEIVKGVLKREDFYEQPEVKTFTDELLKQDDLPQYVQHYSILNPPINTLIGEMSKRPDNTYVKAFDEDSKSEELQFKTDILNQYIFENAKQMIMSKLAMNGQEVSEEDLDAMTQEKVTEYLTNYTSTAEKWGSTVIEYMKVRFGMKEKSEDAFRDLLVAAREYFHIYEDKSKEGFNIEVLNPKNVWVATLPDQKYVSDPFDLYKGAYASGTIHIMEISELINKFDLDVDEIKHLMAQSQQNYLLTGHESTLTHPNPTGHNSVQYDTYNPLILQERLWLESQISGSNNDELDRFLLPGSDVATFGNKFIVIRAYWCSKKKVGELTFINEDDEVETTLVDENYKDKSHPRQISLTWGWINQWYQGVKIGPDVYKVKPFELLEYCPIIGSIFENKNTEAKSLVDLLKPFQTICNIYMNKLYESIQKDVGNIPIVSLRHIPTLKDGDDQDAMDVWMAQAREQGIMFIDDSPENMKSPSSFNQYTVLQMSRVQEMQGYFNMYEQIKSQAWELVGISRQRLGAVAATETATGTNAALTQSYAQTEPWFMHHEYTMNKVYQALLDAALYIESNKPVSTLSFISSEGEQCFLKVNGSDLKLRDLGVFVTSRAKDAQIFESLRSLSQAMLQNGASPYEIAELYTTQSVRQIKNVLKTLKEEQDANLQKQQELQQQELQQRQQQFEQQQQLAIAQHDKDVANDNYNKEQDRINKREIAIITATGFGKVESEDVDQNNIPDVLQTQKLSNEQLKSKIDYEIKLKELNLKQQKILQDGDIKQQQIDLGKEKVKAEKQRTNSSNKKK